MNLDEQAVKKRLGAFLREIRIRRKLALNDVATAIGRSKTYVCDVESGRRGGSRMPADVCASWAAYLSIPVSAIAEKQQLSTEGVTSMERYRSYMRILRNSTRSHRIYEAVNTLRMVAREAQETDLSMTQTKKLFDKVSKAVEIIDSCLVYSK